MLTVLAGLFAGVVHVLAGPDHLAAVAPMAASRPARAWLTGLTWGCGHTAGVLGVALGALLLRGLLPVAALSSWSERLVGAALVGIGLWGLRQALLRRWHAHTHSHDGVPHTHAHLPVAMGVLHGLAGAAHVLGVLPALALPSGAAPLVYLAGFGAGSIAAMGGYGWLLGWALHRLGPAGLRPHRVFLAATSGAAIAVGAVWLAA